MAESNIRAFTTKDQIRDELKRRGDWTPELEEKYNESKNKFDKSDVRPLKNKEDIVNELKRRGDWTPELEEIYRSENAPKEETSWEESKRHLARGAKNVAAGLASGVDLLTLPVRAGLNAASDATGLGYHFPSGQEYVNNKVDELSGGYTAPRNKSEKIADSIIQEVSSLPTGAGVGKVIGKAALKAGRKGIEKLGKFIENSNATNVTNVAGTAGAAGAARHHMETEENPSMLGTFGMGMLGGLGGSLALPGAKLAGQTAAHYGRKGIGKLSGFSPEAYASRVEAGAPVSLATVSEGSAPQMLESILRYTPGASKPIRQFHKKQADYFGSKLGLGDTEFNDIPHIVNKELPRLGAEKLQRKESAKYEKNKGIFEPLTHRLKEKRHEVDVSDLIADITGKEGLGLTQPAEKKLFGKSVAGQFFLKELYPLVGNDNKLIKALESENFSPEIIDRVLKKIPEKSTISYAALDSLRDQMLNLKNKSKPGTPDYNQASRLYDQLAKKRHQTIESVGTPAEVKAFKEANQDWAQYANKEKSILKGKEVGSKEPSYKITGNDSDESTFNLMLSSNPKYLDAAMKGLDPKEQTQLMQSVIAHLGTKGDNFDLGTFYNKFIKKSSPFKDRVRNSFKNEDAKEGFDKVLKFMGENKSRLEAASNTSRTAHFNHYIDLIKQASNATKAIVGGIASGGVGTAAFSNGVEGLIGIGTLLYGSRKAAQLMTDPIFLQRVNKAMTSKNPIAQANFFELAMKSPVVKDIFKNSAVKSALVIDKNKENKPLKVKVTEPIKTY